MSSIEQVNPARFSEAENEFLLGHLGEAPVVASRSIGSGVNRNAVMPLIQRVYELEQLQKHEGEEWAGVETVKEGIALYLDVYRKWRSEKRKGAPKFPSLFIYSPKGRPIYAGPGADAGIVQSYFGSDGQRHSFLIDLIPDDREEWDPSWSSADELKVEDGLKVDNELHRIECFCGHVEKFREENRSSYNAARARMSKHLRSTNEEVERHREVYAMAFGS